MENRRTATGPLLGRGMTAEIFAWDPGTVLKLFLPGWGSGVRDYEARGRRMAEAHRALHRPAVPGLPGWKDRFRGQIGRCAPLLGSRTPGLLGSLEGLVDGRQVCHGDFHHGNILVDGRLGPAVL